MKRFFLILIFCLISSVCFSEEPMCELVLNEPRQLLMSRPRTMEEVDRSKFYAYKDRMKQKRSSALELRRIYNSGKVHKYWTAVVYPRYYPYYYQYVPTYRVERSEYRYDYQYSYGY